MSHWKIVALLCDRCELPFEGRKGQIYCTHVCKEQAYRARRTKRHADSYTEEQIVTVLGEVLAPDFDELIDVITEKLRAL